MIKKQFFSMLVIIHFIFFTAITSGVENDQQQPGVCHTNMGHAGKDANLDFEKDCQSKYRFHVDVAEVAEDQFLERLRNKGPKDESLWSVGDSGFLPNRMPLDQLPKEGGWGLIDSLASLLPSFSSTGEFREKIDQKLEEIGRLDLTQLPQQDEGVLTRLHSLLSFISLGYIKGSPTQERANLPAPLTRIYVNVSSLLNRKPMLDYADCVLYNWNWNKKEDSENGRRFPTDPSEFHLLTKFTGIIDEDWFFKIHVLIEAIGRKLVWAYKAALQCIQEAELDSPAQHSRNLTSLFQALQIIWKTEEKIHKDIMPRMYENCMSPIFFFRLRHFLGPIKDINYEGHGYQSFTGPSGAHSSLFELLDWFLGVPPPEDTLQEQIDNFHTFRPPLHRDFLQKLRNSSITVRSFLQGLVIHEDDRLAADLLVKQYNLCIDHLILLRTQHMKFVNDYIYENLPEAARNQMNDDRRKGTGGADPEVLLTRRTLQTELAHLPNPTNVYKVVETEDTYVA